MGSADVTSQPDDSFRPFAKTDVLLFAGLALLSTSIKVYLAGLGQNFDVESWAIFADIIFDGKIVYAETYRNPYGPIWSYLCAAIRYIQIHLVQSESLVDFHRLIALVLSGVDISIAYLLARRHSFVAGILFLINPVSMLISGFHAQFGNLAILLAFLSCVLLDEPRQRPWKFALAMLLLGLSLVTKHVLIFLPLWFFLRPGWTRRKRLMTLAPLFVLAVSFLPFVHDERALEGIIEYVFLYDSFHLDGFYPKLVGLIVPLDLVERVFAWVPVFSGFKFLWLATMLAVGFALRNRSFQEQLFIYVMALLVFSSALADQYLAIPLTACAVYWRNVWVWFYVALSSLYLSASGANIGMLDSLSSYAETVRASGLDRWHSVAMLAIFLALYYTATRLARLADPRHVYGWIFPLRHE